MDLVLDVGANQGQYVRELRMHGYRGRVVSFEPLSDAYDTLSGRTEGDSRWSAMNVALGLRDGTAVLNVAGNDGASSSMLEMRERHLEAAPASRYVSRVEVPVRCLDSVWDEVAAGATRPFLKLDVQGFEAKVLDGGAKSLPQLVGLQLEISLVPLYESGMGLKEALRRSEELGMRLVTLNPGFSDPATGDLLQVDGVFMRDA